MYDQYVVLIGYEDLYIKAYSTEDAIKIAQNEHPNDEIYLVARITADFRGNKWFISDNGFEEAN